MSLSTPDTCSILEVSYDGQNWVEYTRGSYGGNWLCWLPYQFSRVRDVRNGETVTTRKALHGAVARQDV